jgi:hypothetical protein
MSDSLQLGDKVRLSSDPQPMTIDSIEEDTAICIWLFNGNQKQGQFALTSLMKIKESESTVQDIDRRSVVDKFKGNYFPQ